LLHEQALRRIFKERRIDAVIHFAGLKAVGESVRHPLWYFHNNITGTLNLCSIMAEFGCKRMVFSSSATVYGIDSNEPISEEATPRTPINPYGKTKLMIERILGDICVSDPEWSVVSLRYFNPAGAHTSGLIGEDPKGIPNNLLPYIAKVANGELEKLSVFGDDYDTPDGTGIRDYIHVVDLAKAHICALRYAFAHTGQDVINLGTGMGYSVFEIIAAFERASGKKIPYQVAPRRPGDLAVCYANPSKAKSVLGWSAERDLDAMCFDIWHYTQRRG